MADKINIDDLPPPPEMGSKIDIDSLPPPPEMKAAKVNIDDLPPPPEAPSRGEFKVHEAEVKPKFDSPLESLKAEELSSIKFDPSKLTGNEQQAKTVQGIEKFQKEGKQTLSTAWQEAKDTAKLAVVPFQMAQRLIVGNAVKTLRPDLYESLKKADIAEEQNPDKQQIFSSIDKALNTIAPDLYVSQMFVDKQAKLMEDMGINKSVARVAAAGTGLVADILTDPLTYVTLGASTSKHIKKLKASEEVFQKQLSEAVAKGESTADILIDRLKKDIPAARPFSQQIADGDKAMVSMKIPFTSPDKSVVLVKGETAAKLWENAMQSDIIKQAKRAVPWLQMETGNLRVDDAFTKHTMWDAATKMKVAELSAQIPQYEDNIKNIVNAIEQYGPEKAKGYLEKVAKVKVNDNEFEAAQGLYNQLKEIHDSAAELNGVGKLNGKDVFKPANLDDRIDLISELKNKIPGFKDEWIPYAFREQYGLPRTLTKDAKFAEQARLNRTSDWTNTMSGGGKFKMTANAEKESSKFSTFVQDLLKGKETGLVTSFETDPIKRTLDSVKDMYMTEGNKRFVEEILDHGWTQKQVDKFKQLRRDGEKIPRELQGLLNVDVNSLKPIDEYPFEKLKSFVAVDPEVKAARRAVKEGTADVEEAVDVLANPKAYKARITRDDFLTTPEIALGIENRFGPSQTNKGLMSAVGIKWYNDQWRRTVLTNPLRLPREAVENMAAYGMARGNPKYLVSAPADIFKFSMDPKKNKADWFTTAFFNSPYAEHIGNFDAEVWKKPMSMEQVVNHQVNNVPFMQTLHDTAKSGQREAFGDLLNITEKELRGSKFKLLDPRIWVEKLTDNPWARNVRNFVGGTASNSAKLALAKTYHYDHGLSFYEAMAKADKAMVSFIDVNKSVKAARDISPFISYNLRNIQRLPILMAASPAGVDFYNKVKQAVSNYNGWTPEDNVVFANLINGATAPDPIIGSLLRGTESMKKDPEFVSDYIGTLGRKILGDDKYDKMMKEKQFVSWYLPDPYRSSINFANPEKAIENFGPALKAGIALLGIDPFTGKQLPYAQTDLAMEEKFNKAIDEANPLQYHAITRLYQTLARARATAFKENLVNQGKDPAVVDSEYKAIYGDNWVAEKNKDKKALGAAVSWATLGLGTLTNLDFQFTIKQMSLAKEQKTLQSDFMKKKYAGKDTPGEMEKVKKAIKDVRKEIHFNSDLMEGFRKSLQQGKPFLNQVEKELDRQPQGYQSMLEKIGNIIIPGAQAMGAGSPRESEIVSRGSALTRKNLKPMSVDQQEAMAEQAAVDEQQESERLFNAYKLRTGEDPQTDDEVEAATEAQKDYEENK